MIDSDRLRGLVTDRLTDICDCRVAFAIENLIFSGVHSFSYPVMGLDIIALLYLISHFKLTFPTPTEPWERNNNMVGLEWSLVRVKNFSNILTISLEARSCPNRSLDKFSLMNAELI